MRLLDIARKDLIQILFRGWMAPFFLVIMPISFTAFMGVAFRSAYQEEDPRLAVGVIVEDLEAGEPTSIAVSLIDLLGVSEAIRPVILDEGEAEDADQMIIDAELAGAAIIPAGFEGDLLVGDLAALTLRVDTSSNAAYVVQNEVQAAVARLLGAAKVAELSVETHEAQDAFGNRAERQAVYEAALTKGVQAWADPPFALEETGTGLAQGDENGDAIIIDRDMLSFAQSSPGMIIQFGIAGLVGSATLLVNERKSRTLERMLTTATPRRAIIGGKLLAYFLIIMLQVTILAVFGQVVYKLPYFNQPLALLMLSSAYALALSAMGLLIGSVAKSDNGVVILTLVPMFVLSGWGGAWVPLEFTSESINRLAHVITPTAWAMDGFRDIIIRGYGVEAVLMPVGVLLLWALGLFGLAVWRLRFVE